MEWGGAGETDSVAGLNKDRQPSVLGHKDARAQRVQIRGRVLDLVGQHLAHLPHHAAAEDVLEEQEVAVVGVVDVVDDAEDLVLAEDLDAE